jgi:hypothetical protein
MSNMNHHIRLLHEALLKGENSKYAMNFLFFGESIVEAWKRTDPLVTNDEKEKENKLARNLSIRKYLSQVVIPSASEAEKNLTPKPIKSQNKKEHELRLKLHRVLICLDVWEDPHLSREADANAEAGQNQNKRERQLIKDKGPIEIEDRRKIRVALFAYALILMQETNACIDAIQKYQKKNNFPVLENTLNTISTFENNITTTQKLIDFFKKHIILLESSMKSRDGFDPPNLNIHISEYLNTAKGFSSLPTKKKKSLKIIGIFIAVIIAIACGLSTGGAIYFLIIPSAYFVAIFTGILIFIVGFIANFRFYSQNIPNFLITLTKKGSVTELINREGKREQFSPLKKYLILPLAGFASLTVGVSGAALTFSPLVSFLGLTFLVSIWTPLPYIIAGIAVVAIFVALMVSTLTASIDLLKKPLPTWKELVQWAKDLKPIQILSYAILVIVSLAGLILYRIIAEWDLTKILKNIMPSTLASVISQVFAVVSFLAQALFYIMSLNKFCNIIKNFFSEKKCVSLIGNAVGNGALIYNSDLPVLLHPVSAVFGSFNSLIGNISEQDPNQSARALATTESIKMLVKIGIFAPTKEKSSVSSEVDPSFIEKLHLHREPLIKKTENDEYVSDAERIGLNFPRKHSNSLEILVTTHDETESARSRPRNT